MPHAKRGRSLLKRAGVRGYNKPKRTPSHPRKSHIVVAKVGHTVKTIRFGQQGAKTAGKPKKGETHAPFPVSKKHTNTMDTPAHTERER